jgi:hypothetical protein
MVVQCHTTIKNTEYTTEKDVHGTLCKVRVSLVRFKWNVNFLDRFSKNTFKFHENPSSGSRVVPCGQTDRYEEDNTYLSQYCESAKKNAGCRLLSGCPIEVLNITSFCREVASFTRRSTIPRQTLLCNKNLNRHCKFSISSVFWTFNSGVHNSRATKSVTVTPNIFGSSAWNVLHVTILVPWILTWFLHCFKYFYTPGLNATIINRLPDASAMLPTHKIRIYKNRKIRPTWKLTEFLTF